MTTTLVRDSMVGDDWIRQTMQAVPAQPVYDEAGNPTGDILTGLVRLAFVDLLTPKSKDDPNDPDTYGAALLFPPQADIQALYNGYYEIAGQKFPEYYDHGSGQYHGLHSPFHDQADKARFLGFTPGALYFNSSSQYKPSITDGRLNPIVDPSKVYPGVWAICGVKPYPFDRKGKRGVGFGLQTVMIVGDDTNMGGGGPDVKQMYKGINVTAPITRPDMANQAAAQGAPAQPAPAAAIPGYTAPGGGVAPQAAPQQPVQAAPAAPSHQPPQATPPAQPAAAPQSAPSGTQGAPSYAPPATTYPTNQG